MAGTCPSQAKEPQGGRTNTTERAIELGVRNHGPCRRRWSGDLHWPLPKPEGGNEAERLSERP
eukprot:10325697-Alexandrium_andersonii.AAC.1